MASLKGKIVTITKPTLKLDTLEFDSVGEGETEDSRANTSKGMNILIMINQYTFDEDDITNMELDCNGSVPTISLVINDSTGMFNVDTFPRDGDVINLRIGTLDKKTYKDIRMDFDITYVDTPPQQSDATNGTYMFMGRAKIPGFFADECKSYGEGTSLEHLELIANDLGLGFATNIETSNDSMHLILPFTTRYETMIDLVRHSYVDDESFQAVSIDAYYNINYVNLNSIFNGEDTFDDAIMAYNAILDDSPTAKDDDVNQRTLPLFLSNHARDEGTNRYITGQALQNISGGITMKNGYKRTIQYYEMDSEDGLVSHDITPMSTKNMKDIEEPMRGRRDEDRYKHEVKYKYLGRRTGDVETTNTHINYEYAAVANEQNMDECRKMSLEVSLETFNPAIHRYQRIPIAVYTNEMDRLRADKFLKEKKAESEFDTEKVSEDAIGDPAAHVLDEFMSGYYIVDGITYTYRSGQTNVKQRLKLLRREWPTRINNINPKTVAKAPTPTVKVPVPAPLPPPTPPVAPVPVPVPPPAPTPPPPPALTFELKALDWRAGYGSWLEQTRLFKWTALTGEIEVTPSIKIKIDAGGPNEKILSGEVFTETQVEGSSWNKKEYNAKVLIPGGLYEGKENEEFKVEITLKHKDITKTIERTIKFVPWEPNKKIGDGGAISNGKKKNKRIYSWAVFSSNDIGVYEGKYTLSSEASLNATGSLMSGVITGSDISTLKNQTESAWKSEWQSAG